MDSFIIKNTNKTPAIRFIAEEGKLQISGNSIPENASEFYTPVLKNIHNHLSNTSLPLQVDISFVYLNTGTAKCILNMFRLLESSNNNSTQVLVNWYYEKNNDDIHITGNDYRNLFSLPFNLKLKEIEIDLTI